MGDGPAGSYGEPVGSFVDPYTDPNFAPTVGPAYGPTTGGSPVGGVYSPDPGTSGSNPSGGGNTSGGSSPSSGPSGGQNGPSGGTTGGGGPSSGPSGGPGPSGSQSEGASSGSWEGPYVNYSNTANNGQAGTTGWWNTGASGTDSAIKSGPGSSSQTPTSATNTTPCPTGTAIGDDGKSCVSRGPGSGNGFGTTTSPTPTNPCPAGTAVSDDGKTCVRGPGSPATGQATTTGTSLGDSVRKAISSITSPAGAGTAVVDSIRKAMYSVPVLKTAATALDYGRKAFGQVIDSVLNNSDSGSNSYADFVKLRSIWTPSASTTDSGVRATSSAPGLPVAYDGHPDSVSQGTKPVSNIANVTNTIAFEIKIMKADKSLFTGWRAATGTISVPSGSKIYLRWSANEYAQCLPFFGDSGRYALTATNQTMRTGDTEASGYELVASNTTYRIECGGQSNGEPGVDQRAVNITVTGSSSPAPGTSDSGNQTVCTMDAKMCPDGSYVGRSGPNCEFTACPTSTTNSSSDSGR